MRLKVFSCVAGFVLAACGGGATTPAAPAPAPVATVGDIPKSVGKYSLFETRGFPDFPTDTMHRFTDSARVAHITVYRFPIRPEVRVGTDTLGWLRHEGEKFAVVQRLLVQRGVYQSADVRVARLDTVTAGGVPLAEYMTGVRVQTRNGSMNELEYLYMIGGRFLKVRVTERETGQTSSEAPAFARAVAERVLRSAKR